jgi:toxin secretion/phage lysis holin
MRQVIPVSNSFVKIGLATLMGIVSAHFKIVTIPLILLLILMLIDYGTGISSAWIKGVLSSRKSISGILKKVGYLAVIVVGVVCDYLIEYAFSAIGYDSSTSYAVGVVIIIWLILNECMSILENLSIIGVPIPKFLKGIVNRLKIVTEQTTDVSATSEEDNSEGENTK